MCWRFSSWRPHGGFRHFLGHWTCSRCNFFNKVNLTWYILNLEYEINIGSALQNVKIRQKKQNPRNISRSLVYLPGVFDERQDVKTAFILVEKHQTLLLLSDDPVCCGGGGRERRMKQRHTLTGTNRTFSSRLRPLWRSASYSADACRPGTAPGIGWPSSPGRSAPPLWSGPTSCGPCRFFNGRRGERPSAGGTQRTERHCCQKREKNMNRKQKKLLTGSSICRSSQLLSAHIQEESTKNPSEPTQ